MKHFNKINSLLVALALTLVLAVGGTAYAQHGADDTTSDSTSSNSGSGPSSSGRSQTAVATETEHATETETETEHGVTTTTVKNNEHKVKSAEARQKACVAHKHGLETKFARISANSQRIDDRISEVLTKTIAYQQDNSLTVDNWDQLVADANTAKANADEAIAALKAVTPSLDCNNVSVASDVAAFKDQAAKTRDSLKSYRKAVKAVIKALLTAKQEDKAAEGSDQ